MKTKTRLATLTSLTSNSRSNVGLRAGGVILFCLLSLGLRLVLAFFLFSIFFLVSFRLVFPLLFCFFWLDDPPPPSCGRPLAPPLLNHPSLLLSWCCTQTTALPACPGRDPRPLFTVPMTLCGLTWALQCCLSCRFFLHFSRPDLCAACTHPVVPYQLVVSGAVLSTCYLRLEE